MPEQKGKYIVEFADFEQRAKWVAAHPAIAHRLYDRNSWLAAELTHAEVCELEQLQGVRVHPDIPLQPS